jgi:UDP-glucuronate 4-epimerase
MLSNSKETILITGVAGFIGFHTTIKLCSDLSINIIGIDNINDYYDVNLKQSRLEILKKYTQFTFLKRDITNHAEIEEIFKQFKIDKIIHLAAQAGVRYSIENPGVYIQSNILGTYNILELSKRYNISHLVLASSSSVYGESTRIPFDTKDNTDYPVSLYAATKKSNEVMAYSYSSLYSIPITGLRFFTVYGPWGRPDMAYFLFTEKILNNQPIQLYNFGNQFRDFTYIEDVVDGIQSILNKPSEARVPFNIYNIGNNKPEKLLYFVEILEKHLEKRAIVELLPAQLGDVSQTYANIEPIKDLIGFSPKTNLDEGLRNFVNWYKEYYL